MNKSGRRQEALYWESWESPFGRLTVCCSEDGLRRVSLGAAERLSARDKGAAKSVATGTRARGGRQTGARLARQAIAELQQYAAGARKRFTVPLHLEGTPFQRKVWEALRAIPYGETRSYQQIARQVGNPRAARAVGMANHYNPVAIVVPCHRVIASDGSLGGYAGGLVLKSRMLRLEQRKSA